MEKPTLVIMAAGMGSRYGGLKQLDAVGPCGEVIMDYSVYDAKRAGFGKVVFIIKKEIEKDFKEIVGSRIEKHIDVEYVFQQIDNIPSGFEVPADRVKPWGTGHAILSCLGTVKESFAVINADDYYGPESFKLLYDFLSSPEANDGKAHHCMIGFDLSNTLTESGHVARGICATDENDMLVDIVERTKIKRIDDGIYFFDDDKWNPIAYNSIASMNCWGFRNSLLDTLQDKFTEFLKSNIEDVKAEFFLPSVVNQLLKAEKADVKVLKTSEKWFGVTYKEDKENVVCSIKNMINKGIYPERLWK